MPNRKIEKIIGSAKIYLLVIFILLILLCLKYPEFIVPSVVLFAIVLVDTRGNIIWKGSKFMQEFANIDIKSYLISIAKELENKIKTENLKEINTEVKIENKTYKLLGQYVKSKQKKENIYILSLFFIDNTQYQELRDAYREKNTCIGIITIDNYEEIVQRISAEERPQVLARIEKNIYDWTKDTGGLIVKNDRETYVYIFEEKYLEILEKNKFDILDKIKETNKEQITLSIAISNEGDSNYEKYKNALIAMDVALGRGGDQAVIKRNGSYKFYGGRAQEVEKRTKVKARIISQALEELIVNSENVIIMGHKNIDIDALSSALGIYRFAKTLGKDAYIIYEPSIMALGDFVNQLQMQKEYEGVLIDSNEILSKATENTVLVIVDTNKVGYLEQPKLLEKTDKIVVIDHHRKSTDFIENATLTLHEAYASSASELVTEIIEYSQVDIQLKNIEIEALYAGIMLDTKNFTFKTGVRTFEAAAYLKKSGVDIIKVKKWFQNDLDNYNLITDIVKKAEIVSDTIGISVYEDANEDATVICAKAADELLSISNITASFVIGLQGEKVCISGRSIGEINVQVILEKMGGGGHMTNAGAQIEGKTIEEVKTELINNIKEYFEEEK